jgi:chaperone BCS1
VISSFNFFEWLSQNQMVAGGITLAAVGLVVASLRTVPKTIYVFVKRRFTITLDIVEGDESFGWVGLWLAERNVKMRDVSVVTKQGNKLHDKGNSEKDLTIGKKDNRPKIFLTPAPGTHFFRYRGKLMIVYRKRPEGTKDSGSILSYGAEVKGNEGYVITFFTRSTEFPRLLMQEARDLALPLDGKIDVRVSQTKWHGSWQLADRIRPRSIESVILSEDEHLNILEDIKEFQRSYSWYSGLGIPYRRGYLLFGNPGGGKTSLIAAVASSLGMNIYVLSLQSPGITDSILMELLNSVSNNSVILMEDIDCAFVNREKKEQTLTDKLTFSGLLNALDGVGGKDGRIIFMTTNHREKLDSALIRPGRIDYQVEIKNADKDQVRKLFDRFYSGWRIEPELRNRFIATIPNYKYSMAKIQGFLMRHKNNPWGLIAYREELDKLSMDSDDKVSQKENALDATPYSAFVLTGIKKT